MQKRAKTGRRKGDSIVQNYGLYWEKRYVDWSVVGHMYGKTKSNPKVHADFWGQVGIYVLYDRNDAPIYFGQVGVLKHTEEGEGNTLGGRLRAHVQGDFGDQWVRFSWFGVKPVTKAHLEYFTLENKRTVSIKKLGGPKRTGKLKEEIALIEALLIAVLRRGGFNKQEGHWSKIGATRFYQLLLSDIRAENDEDYRLLTAVHSKLLEQK